MASKQEEREQLQELRRGKEEQAKRRQTRLARIYGLAGILVIAIVVGVVLLVASASNSPSSAGAAFGQHYDGLDDRRLEAEVPTMAEGGGSHFHPLLAVYANGKRVTVPANIGIDPIKPPTEMVGLHTHDDTGTIHNEAGTGATLGDFFAVWGVPLSPTELGPFKAKDAETVRVWVDGKPSSRFGDLVLKDGQRIVVAYGTDRQMPDDTAGKNLPG